MIFFFILNWNSLYYHLGLLCINKITWQSLLLQLRTPPMNTTPFTLSSSYPSSPPNTAALHGSFDTGTPPTVNLPLSDCFHLAKEGEHVPVGIIPCLEHPGRARRTIFSLKLSTARVHNGTYGSPPLFSDI